MIFVNVPCYSSQLFSTSRLFKEKMKTDSLQTLICSLFLLLLLLQSRILSASEQVQIGVLAQRGSEITLQKWNPLADYLSKEIPGHSFVIKPIEFVDVSKAVAGNEVGFLLVNSGMYIEMEHSFGVRPIATVRAKRGDKGISLFAGLIITRTDRSDIRTFQDLRGKKFLAVDRDSLGGWLMAKRELLRSGINPEHDFESFGFAGTHDGVVNAVIRGDVDAGTIRSDALERMVEDHLINGSELRVIHGERVHSNFDVGEEDFPFPHSTDIYPEWPMAKLSGTSDDLAKMVAIALLKMPEDDDAAKQAGIKGWDIARNYQSVHDLYRELRIGPYRQINHLRMSDVWQRYWPTIISVAVFLGTLCVLLFILMHLRLRLLKANQNITRMAMYDPLTHLPNRRLFKILAENAFAQARREGWKAYLFLIDLDGFKSVNDCYGHEAGDEVLRQISRRLRVVMPHQQTAGYLPLLEKTGRSEGLLRAEDLIARHGGDEFLSMVIHVKALVDVKAIAQRIIESLRKPIDLSGNQISIGASIGIAAFPDDGQSLEQLVKKADEAMYAVKRSGKGTYQIYEHSLE